MQEQKNRTRKTSFVFSKRDDELVVLIDESLEGACLLVTHAHSFLSPGPAGSVLLQRHD